VADKRPVEKKGASRAALVGRPVALRDERPVRDANRRNVEHGSQVKSETRAAWVVAPRRVHEEDVREHREGTDDGLEKGTLAESQQARLVGRARRTGNDLRCEGSPSDESGSRPAWLARPAAARRPAAREADEAAAAERLAGGLPRLRACGGELLLACDQVLRRRRPEAHGGTILM
jgi:hypothetical protein